MANGTGLQVSAWEGGYDGEWDRIAGERVMRLGGLRVMRLGGLRVMRLGGVSQIVFDAYGIAKLCLMHTALPNCV
jgi:hypothetical protein